MSSFVRAAIVAVGVLLSLVPPVTAGSFEDFDDGYPEYAPVLELMLPLAEHSDIEAQHYIAVMSRGHVRQR